MRIRVLAFASASDALGAGELTLDLPEGARLSDLRVWLDARHPDLAPLWPRLALALDGSIAPADAPLTDGAEVALLPPVSGGADPDPAPGVPAAPKPRVDLVETPIDPGDLLSRVAAPERGAVLLFLGTVRDHARPPAAAGPSAAGLDTTAATPAAVAAVSGAATAPASGIPAAHPAAAAISSEPPPPKRRVLKLTYTAYRPMALQTLDRIAADLEAAAPGLRVAIVHRLGEVAAGEASVAIATAAPHRAEAYAANRQALERLKAEVPIWKREHFASGESLWREEEPLSPPQAPPAPAADLAPSTHSPDGVDLTLIFSPRSATPRPTKA